MTYAEFLFWFLILPILALVGAGLRRRKQSGLSVIHYRYHWRGIFILAGIAFFWTTPWDNLLIALDVWDSPPDRIIARIGYVPVEEYAFFVLMPFFNGALIYLLLTCIPVASKTGETNQRSLRVAVTYVAALLMGGGFYALCHDEGLYLGLTFVWFVPPLLIQWLFDLHALLRGWKIVLLGTGLPLLYFAIADYYAIASEIWVISEARTTGLGLPGLPVEEIFFFGVTSLLLAQGLVLWHSLRNAPPIR